MVSELTEHTSQNLPFIQKHGLHNFLCAHYTLHSDFKVMQRNNINCTVTFTTGILVILAIMFPLNINHTSSEESTNSVQVFWDVMLC